jgi:hypothetical protein
MEDGTLSPLLTRWLRGVLELDTPTANHHAPNLSE